LLGDSFAVDDASRSAASPTFTALTLDGQAIISPDCVPLGLTKMKSNFQERIVAILQESPSGLTSNEIAERLGATAGNISSCLSKLAAYGIIGKTRRGPRGNVYRALTDEQAAT
jgi:predicted transcriptional regulator